jgi:hypothetical protein
MEVAMRTRLACCMVLLGALLLTAGAMPPERTKAPAWRSRLSAASLPGGGRCWRLALHHAGRAVTAGSLPAGAALPTAATLYALATDDLDVSLADLVQAGYWPYALPASAEPEQRIWESDPALLACSALGDCWWLDKVGTVDWRAAAQAQILLGYAAALRTGVAPLTAMKRASAGPPPPPERADLVPLAAFFTNPFTGLPMQESAAPGDFQVLPLRTVLPDGPQLNGEVKVRIISGTLLPAGRPYVTFTGHPARDDVAAAPQS